MNQFWLRRSALRWWGLIALCGSLLLMGQYAPVRAASNQIDLVGPAGSGTFGEMVYLLANGNVVVQDANYSSATAANIGAVYLYDGRTGAQISVLTGSTADDRIGQYPPTLLPNGDYIVYSPYWDDPVEGGVDVGAVTWCSGVTGCVGTISASNSLVGTSTDDLTYANTTILANGNAVITAQDWDDPVHDAADVGVVRWCDAPEQCTGPISSANALIGSSAADRIGDDVTPLPNGSYVVDSSAWDDPVGNVIDVGASTWCAATGGCSGVINPTNSLLGDKPDDRVGWETYVLANGHYVVTHIDWRNPNMPDDESGAATWCPGDSGCQGLVSAENSLIGAGAGSFGIRAMQNGNYLVSSSFWDNPDTDAARAGAITWCDGASGCRGEVSAANSLVGTSTNDRLNLLNVTILPDDNYVVVSSAWDDPVNMLPDVGAVVWCSGDSGCQGPVSAANALIGTIAGARVGILTVLQNGDYAVLGRWDDPSTPEDELGAVRLCAGSSGCQGGFSATNALFGNFYRTEALANGDYAMLSGPGSDATEGIDWTGAVTICTERTSCQGPVSLTNSFLMRTAGDLDPIHVTVTPLENGNYAVALPTWDNPNTGAVNVGAVAWCGDAGRCAGWVDADTALIGTTAFDRVGQSHLNDGLLRYIPGVAALANGNYVVRSVDWNDPSSDLANVGAVTWCSGAGGCQGTISAANSLVGTSSNDRVGYEELLALPNSDYVVASAGWDAPGGAQNVGAVTQCDGAIGCRGVINAENSLIGSSAGDAVGGTVFPLTNAHYVVSSPFWNAPDGTAPSTGAVTWCSGAEGCQGTVSTANSLVGGSPNDDIGVSRIIQVGENDFTYRGIQVLSTGDYIVSGYTWHDPADPETAIGHVTFGDGTRGVSGVVSPTDPEQPTIAGPLQVPSPVLFNADDGVLVVLRPQINTVSLLPLTTTAIADGSFTAAETWNYGPPSPSRPGRVPDGVTVTIDSPAQVGALSVEPGGALTIAAALEVDSRLTLGGQVNGSGTLSLGCAAQVEHADATSFVRATVRKQFCAAGDFSFPVGTAVGYAPVQATITDATPFPAWVEVTAQAGSHPTLDPATALQRFWSLNSSTDVQADLRFSLNPTDLAGDPAIYRLVRIRNSKPEVVPNGSFDPAMRTIGSNGVAPIGDWTVTTADLVALDLTALTAQRQAGAVIVNWQTSAEYFVAGYHILRSTSGTLAEAERLTAAPLAATGGSAAAATYAWSDSTAPATALTYWIEAVDATGAQVGVFGPVQVAAVQPAGAPFSLYFPLTAR